MGCVASKPDINDLHPNIFQVWNVNENGRAHTIPGRLELTDTDLVFYQRGRDPVRWPMRCLRRYGFDAEMFSFECGRRCPTGPGVFAFKCHRSEALFNLLQEHIQNSGQDEQSHSSSNGGPIPAPIQMIRSSSLSDGGYLEPIIRTRRETFTSRETFSRLVPPPPPPPVPVNQNSLSNSLSSSSTGLLSPTIRTSSPNYMNDDANAIHSPTPPVSLTTVHEYVNSSVINESARHPETNPAVVSSDAKAVSPRPEGSSLLSHDSKACPLLDGLVGLSGCNGSRPLRVDDNYAKLDDLLKQEHSVKQRLYMNVKADDHGPSLLSADHCYVNVGPGQVSPNAPSRQVNYVVLDLDRTTGINGSDSFVTPNSPLSVTSLPESLYHSSEGYATIDFDKTVALSNSANPSLDKDESLRKTRHNSTISDLICSRHNSAVSE